MGSRRIYETAEEFDAMVDAYAADAEMRREPLGYAALALFLGFSSRTAFDNYGEYEGFEDSVARARTIVEASYERDLRGPNNSGARFALKNYGWRDTSDVNVQSPDGSMSPTRELSEDELDRELERRGLPRRILEE